MKKIKIIIASFLVFGFLGCDQDDTINTVYDNVNGQTLISFQGTSSDLSVVIDDIGSVDITIESSTVSSSDRTVSVSVDPSSTANPENYALSSTSLVIPAGMYTGTITISGVDNSVETSSETIVLNIDSVSTDSTINSTAHTVNIFQVCPVPAGYFTGNYLLEQVSAQIDGYSLSHGSVVEVVETGETAREFQTEAYITYCSGTFFAFEFNLVCNELAVPNGNTTCSCGNVSDWWGPATVNETYDVADDTVMFLTFTDDQQSDCGSPVQMTYRFTKQ
ncbi:hypothetical protein A9Q84_18410 [Halobacteriovorax marinus]|uniref:Lipoprotein n=1 Tax=Halobacteriovorax marinus TaxID=97084 RepID=A0A1Y5F2Y3_9BACT|nr:hypothetical protein A9Q84_18410 [Halobacteriovorax marinus]